MPYEQVHNILKRAQQFHHKLAEFYQKLDEATDKEKARVKILLQYLQKHEEKLEHKLSTFGSDASKNILDTWVQFPPEERPEKIFDPSRVSKDMSVNDIVVLTLEFDNALLRFYKRARDVATTDEIADVFNDLFIEGERERNNLVQAVFGVEEF